MIKELSFLYFFNFSRILRSIAFSKESFVLFLPTTQQFRDLDLIQDPDHEIVKRG